MNPLVDAILRELDTRCDELKSAVRLHIGIARVTASTDVLAWARREAIVSWFQLQEARGTRNAVRRIVERRAAA